MGITQYISDSWPIFSAIKKRKKVLIFSIIVGVVVVFLCFRGPYIVRVCVCVCARLSWWFLFSRYLWDQKPRFLLSVSISLSRAHIAFNSHQQSIQHNKKKKNEEQTQRERGRERDSEQGNTRQILTKSVFLRHFVIFIFEKKYSRIWLLT